MPTPNSTNFNLPGLNPGDVNVANIFNLLRDEFDRRVGSRPTCLVTNSAAQSIPNAAETALTFNTELADNDGMHDTASNTSRLTVKTAGRYEVGAIAVFAVSAGGTYRLMYLKRFNSAGVLQETFGAAREAFGTAILNATALTQVVCAVGDYFELHMMQDSGGALSTSIPGGTYKHTPLFWATWVASS